MCWWGRGLRWRGTEADALLARPDSPRRCTLPITELRETPPSSAAIRLADSPSAQSFFSNSTRSSVHVIGTHLRCLGQVAAWRNPSTPSSDPRSGAVKRTTPTNLKKSPPHEISYQCATTLLYAVTRAQESGPGVVHMFPLQGCLRAASSTDDRNFAVAPGAFAGCGGALHHVDTAGARNRICERAARRGGTLHFAH